MAVRDASSADRIQVPHRLLRQLLHAGCITAAQAAHFETLALQQQRPLASVLLAHAGLPELLLAQHLAQWLGLPWVDLLQWTPPTDPPPVPPALCQAHQILPVELHSTHCVLAIADPSDRSTMEHLALAASVPVQWVVAPATRLQHCLHAWAGTHHPTLPPLPASLQTADRSTPDPTATSAEEATIDDAPIVKYLHHLLREAVHQRASDLHFEPYEHNYRIRFRIDGVLHEVAHPPVHAKDSLASRLKVMARLDIAERRLPQDGRVQLALEGTAPLDLRVATLPTLFGEKLVVRLLNTQHRALDWSTQGLEPAQQDALRAALHKPYGMLLVTGPTGSGKTVCLYSCLQLLNLHSRNICTVEDPAEIYMAGINQVNVHEKAGLGFATVLRALLRQDPDVLMVGEIRDRETADIAVKAAQTGHLLLSTLHTNDAPSALTRLSSMGVPAFHTAAAVVLITAQRLVRRLCSACKQPESLPPQALLAAGYTPAQLEGDWTPYRAVGCSACTSGYRGRLGIFQVMPISPSMQALLVHDNKLAALRAQAQREGIANLRQSGLQRVRQGLTSLSEVLAATEPD